MSKSINPTSGPTTTKKAIVSIEDEFGHDARKVKAIFELNAGFTSS